MHYTDNLELYQLNVGGRNYGRKWIPSSALLLLFF